MNFGKDFMNLSLRAKFRLRVGVCTKDEWPSLRIAMAKKCLRKTKVSKSVCDILSELLEAKFLTPRRDGKMLFTNYWKTFVWLKHPKMYSQNYPSHHFVCNPVFS